MNVRDVVKKRAYKLTALFIMLLLSSALTAQQSGIIEGRIYFEDTVDVSAEPPDSISNLPAWFMSNMSYTDNDCLDLASYFYYDIYVLANGRVTKWALIQEDEESYCEFAIVEPHKIPEWTPAMKDGQPCNQRLKMRVRVHLK